LILAKLAGDDVILCQITSRHLNDEYSILLETGYYSSGSLKQESNVRPNRIFTADKHIILYKAAHLKPSKMKMVTEKVIEILCV